MASSPLQQRRSRRRSCRSASLPSALTGCCLFLLSVLSLSGGPNFLLPAVAALKRPDAQCDCTPQVEAIEKELQGKIDSSTSELTSVQSKLDKVQKDFDEVLNANKVLGTELQSTKEQLTTLQASSSAQAEIASKLTTAQAALDSCRLETAESTSRENDAVQSERQLRDALARAESDAAQTQKESTRKMAELSKEVESSRSQVKAMNDRYSETRRELLDAQRTNRELHAKLVSRYVNTTLLYEDGIWLADRTKQRTWDAADYAKQAAHDAYDLTIEAYEAYREVVAPVVADAVEEATAFYGKAKEAVAPHVASAKEAIRPHVEAAKTKGKELYEAHAKDFVDEKIQPPFEQRVVPLWVRAGEAVESCRLTAISAIEEGATFLLDVYSNNEADLPSWLQGLPMPKIHWMKDNAEYIVQVASYTGLACLVLLVLFGTRPFRWVFGLVWGILCFVVNVVTFPFWLPFWAITTALGIGRGKQVQEEAEATPAHNGQNGH